jgi:hypothetical protein
VFAGKNDLGELRYVFHLMVRTKLPDLSGI